jgi:hypothetical protein
VAPIRQFSADAIDKISRTVREQVRRERGAGRQRQGRWHKKGGTSTNTPTDGDPCDCCQFVAEGSTVLSDGIVTTKERQLCGQLNTIEWRVDEGFIVLTFPSPADMKLVRDQASDDLVWSIPSSVFSAQYFDDSDATSSLSGQTGTVRFKHRTASSDAACPCEDMVLDIEFDAVLAAQSVTPVP